MWKKYAAVEIAKQKLINNIVIKVNLVYSIAILN